MGVAVVYGSELCAKCVQVAAVTVDDSDRVRVAVEINDLCGRCACNRSIYVRFVDASESMMKEVQRISPWWQAIRWQERWLRWWPVVFIGGGLALVMLFAYCALAVARLVDQTMGAFQ